MNGLRYAIRALWKTPVFTVVVVLTLALGIGANTAIFSVVDAVLLRPLPYPEADRIVSFSWVLAGGAGPANVSPLTFQYWHDHARSFDGFTVTSRSTYNLTSASFTARVSAERGTADFFRVMRVSPILGRGFTTDDCVPGAPPVSVISYGLWQRAFGASPDAVGKQIILNDRPFTVIGVMPSTFVYEPAADLWNPLQLRVDPRDRGLNYTVMGRLRDGITLEAAQSETDTLLKDFQQDNRDHIPRNTRTIGLIRFQDFLVADMRPLLLVLLGAVAVVLMIACGNVANLLLSRSAARQRDVAIRSALGAGTRRLARQVLTESLILSVTGGAAGLFLAFVGVRAIVALIPGEPPRLHSVVVDYRVLMFALLISLTSGAVFGLIGAMRLIKNDPGGVLKAAAGTGVDTFRHRLSNALVVSEVAMSLILLVGAGLLVTTFMNLRGIRLGFDTKDILTVELPFGSSKYNSTAAVAQLDHSLIERIGAIPGVASVTTASSIPLERGPNFIFGIEGDPPEKINYVEMRSIGPEYFRTLAIPLRAGRSLTVNDNVNSLPVVVANEALARLLGGPASAIGRRVIIGRTTGQEDVPREVVGVVSNVADGRPGTRLFPTLYVPLDQVGSFTGTAAVLIRTDGAVNIGPELRGVIQSIDPQLPVTKIRTMAEVASGALAQQRFNMTLISMFAAAALLLAMIGLYGVLSYQVAQRTREIGVRMALGARRSRVLRMIMFRGLVLASTGLVIGVAGALALTRFLRTLLFGVSPNSPWVLLWVTAMLLLIALAACFIPARRAMRVDPVIALRYE